MGYLIIAASFETRPGGGKLIPQGFSGLTGGKADVQNDIADGVVVELGLLLVAGVRRQLQAPFVDSPTIFRGQAKFIAHIRFKQAAVILGGTGEFFGNKALKKILLKTIYSSKIFFSFKPHFKTKSFRYQFS